MVLCTYQLLLPPILEGVYFKYSYHYYPLVDNSQIPRRVTVFMSQIESLGINFGFPFLGLTKIPPSTNLVNLHFRTFF